MEHKWSGYKGFGANLTCRGFVYEVGKSYTHDGKLSLCNSGFHAVSIPMDAWSYYPPTTGKYANVKLEGLSEEKSKDSKRVGSRITIGAKIGLADFIKAHVQIVIESADKNTATGYSGHAEATGDYGVSFSGFWGKAKAGTTGSFAIAWIDQKNKHARFVVGVPGEDGIKADTWYSVNDAGVLQEDAEK